MLHEFGHARSRILHEVFDHLAERRRQHERQQRGKDCALTALVWASVFLAGDAYKAFVEEDTKRITGILDSLGLRK